MNWWSRETSHTTGEPVPALWPNLPAPAPQVPGADPGDGEAAAEARLVAMAEARAQELAARARAEGYAEGVRAGEEALALARAEREALEAELAESREWLAQTAARLEEAALGMARELAEAALARELSDPGEQVLAEARRLLASHGPGVLKVAPSLAPGVEKRLGGAEGLADVQADGAVAPGDALLEHDGGAAVAGPTWRWRRLVRALAEEAMSHGGD